MVGIFARRVGIANHIGQWRPNARRNAVSSATVDDFGEGARVSAGSIHFIRALAAGNQVRLRAE
jgi:hypothetical protein